MESEWIARRREGAAGRLCPPSRTAPLKPTPGLSGPPAALQQPLPQQRQKNTAGLWFFPSDNDEGG